MKGYGPAAPDQSPRFAGIPTFLRLPHVRGVEGIDVGVLGVPWDAESHWRTGARFGPAAVREASLTLRPFYNPAQRVAPFDLLSVADLGNADVVPGFTDRTLARLTERLSEVHEAGAVPLCLGGDESILLGELRAAAAAHGRLSLVLFDAHSDTWDEFAGARYVHGTIVRRAVEEELIDPQRSFLFGARGGTFGPHEIDDARRLGFTVVRWDELAQLGTGMVEAVADAAGGEAFLSFDVDFVDPAFAPAVSGPEVGGPSSMQALALLRGCRGLRIVGADVNSVAPEHDNSSITAVLAATVAFEILSLIACTRDDDRRREQRGDGAAS
ncbi:MAG: agmatinase [Actinobacteria bacterium]|nr:agmatinase [Actinomycetota bacterium]